MMYPSRVITPGNITENAYIPRRLSGKVKRFTFYEFYDRAVNSQEMEE
jgi:hypothetical protein